MQCCIGERIKFAFKYTLLSLYLKLSSCFFIKTWLNFLNLLIYFWFITDFWNLIKEQQPQGGLTIDSRWL
jgi:hypothetical protein